MRCVLCKDCKPRPLSSSPPGFQNISRLHALCCLLYSFQCARTPTNSRVYAYTDVHAHIESHVRTCAYAELPLNLKHTSTAFELLNLLQVSMRVCVRECCLRTCCKVEIDCFLFFWCFTEKSPPLSLKKQQIRLIFDIPAHPRVLMPPRRSC